MYTLITNKYTGPEITLKLSKPYKLHYGMKVIKFLGKISNFYNISSFESFRLVHSQILNEKNITGTLCLSIHPLDYMTMSDNDNGWDSCMNWIEGGEFRRGTVEMMNSKNVIVAYIKSNTTNLKFYINNNKNLWNSKKWRELFIVDSDILIGVKGYPYESMELENAVFNWISELAKINLEKEYSLCFKEYSGHRIDNLNIFFTTDAMYSDFNCTSSGSHRARISEKFNNFLNKENAYFDIEYSGPSECMCCGKKNVSFINESDLMCDCCEPGWICDCCGAKISMDDEYTIIDNDYKICAYCEEYDTFTDPIDGELHLLKYAGDRIYIINNEKEINENFCIPNYNKIILYNTLRDYDLEDLELLFINGIDSIKLYDNTYYYVFESELTNHALYYIAG